MCGGPPEVPPGVCGPLGYFTRGGYEGGLPGRCGRDVLGEVYEEPTYVGVWIVVSRN